MGVHCCSPVFAKRTCWNGAKSTKNDPHSVDSESDLALVASTASKASKALRTMAVTEVMAEMMAVTMAVMMAERAEVWLVLQLLFE